VIDLRRVVRNRKFRSQIEVVRAAPVASGSYVHDGIWQPGKPTTFKMWVVVMPSKTADLMRFLPEGERQEIYITIYSEDPIIMGNGRDLEPDVIVWGGNSYKVAFSKPWESIAGYWFAMCRGFMPDQPGVEEPNKDL